MVPIYIRITSERHKVEISTGSFIKPTDWNTIKHCVKSTVDHVTYQYNRNDILFTEAAYI